MNTPAPSPKTPAALPVLIVVLLASVVLSQPVPRVFEAIGIDFYHFWGVPVAMRLTGHTLGSPYTQGPRYSEVLKQYAATANQPKLTAAARFWTGPDFTASPLLYTAFAVVSSDYAASLQAFQVIQMLSFVAACLLLGHLYRVGVFHLLCFTLLCFVFYQPLLSDLRVANLGCLQFLYLTVVLYLASALPRVSAFGRRAGLAAALLAALAVLTLCKPNVALISVLMTMHLLVRHGRRLFLIAAVPAAVVAAAALGLASLYFHSWTVWREWYRFVYGSNAYMLVRPVTQGNYSTAVLLSSWIGVDVYVAGVVLAALLGLSLIVASVRGGPSWSPAALWRNTLTCVFEDPRVALAIGVLVTVAVSPVYWLHYYVVALIPSLWFLNASRFARSRGTLAAVAVVMSSGLLGVLLWALRWPGAVPSTIALSWLPLWCALLVGIHAPESGDRRDVPTAAGKPTASGAGGGRRHKR